jgi:hypothetical protein
MVISLLPSFPYFGREARQSRKTALLRIHEADTYWGVAIIRPAITKQFEDLKRETGTIDPAQLLAEGASFG